MDFYGFLTDYCENILDIECKKSTFYLYQKNQKFQTSNNFYPNQNEFILNGNQTPIFDNHHNPENNNNYPNL
jgi:hypothetical protein